ncbi:hypothetical protein BGX34_000035 [Mortierella sp. NVP85]|nr:hypothetical protein BGX34_000035 [Mortierella sp. NVP85]
MALTSYITTFMTSRNSPAAETTTTTTTTTSATATTSSTVTTAAQDSADTDIVIDSGFVQLQEVQEVEIVQETMDMVVDSQDMETYQELDAGSKSGDDSTQNENSERHIRTLLGNTLPVGTVVSDDTLSSLTHFWHAIVRESSEAAARKVLSSPSAKKTAARSSTATISKGSGSKNPRPRKNAASTRQSTSAKGELRGIRTPLKIQKQAAKEVRGKAAVAAASTSTRKAKGGRSPLSTRQTRSSEPAVAKKPAKATKKASKTKDDVEEMKGSENEEEEEEYEVQEILNHRAPPGQDIKFKIWWKGYPRNQSTWELEDALAGCQDLLKEYAEKHGLKL